METYANTKTRTQKAIGFVMKSHPKNLILRVFPRRVELNSRGINYYKKINEGEITDVFRDVVLEIKREGYEVAHVVGNLVLQDSKYLPKVIDFRRAD